MSNIGQSEGPANEPALTLPPIKDKKGRSTSCYLCQKRKQKCDQRSPSCTNCIKANVQCVQPPRYGANNKPNVKDEYTLLLEKKVKQLEKLLDEKTKKMVTSNSTELSGQAAKALKYRKISPMLPQESAATQEALPNKLGGPAPPIIPPNEAPFNQFDYQLSQPFEIFMNTNQDKYNKSLIVNYHLKDFLKYEPIFNMDVKLSKQCLDIYFALLQYKFPLLNESEVFKFHNDYYNKIQYQNEDFYHFSCARMFLIYAISTMLHQTTGKYRGPNPYRFISSALRHIVFFKNIEPLRKIEILILLCFLLIRTDKDSSGLYVVIQDAMKSCLQIHLHRAKSYQRIPNDLKDRRMRCFWCAYLLEKSIAIAVSKPFILKESKADSDLPLFDYEPSKAIHPGNGTTFINQSIKIRRIEARFIEQLKILSSASIVTRDQLPEVEKFFQELQDWRKECQGFKRGIENETLSVYYYRSVRNLIQPFLELLDPEDRLFRECQAAAGQICQSIKAFHQKTVSGHSIINIHTTFIAGVTLIYCLWLHRNRDDMRRKLLGDDKKHTRPAVSEALFSGLDDLRACSISLYVMAERTKFAISFRDTFDEIMHATIGNLILRCGPDSSEIIYSSEPGMPPAIVRKPTQHYTVESKLNITKTDADKLEEEEITKRKGQLTRSAIPRGLSHLLIHSPPSFPRDTSSMIPPPLTTSNVRSSSPTNSNRLPLPNNNSSVQPPNLSSLQNSSSSMTSTSPTGLRKIGLNSSTSPYSSSYNNSYSLSSTTTLTNRIPIVSATSPVTTSEHQSLNSPNFSHSFALPPLPPSATSTTTALNQQSPSISTTPNYSALTTPPPQHASTSYTRTLPIQPNTTGSNQSNQSNNSSNTTTPHSQQSQSSSSNSYNPSGSGSINGSTASTSSNQQTPVIPELLPFVGRTTAMINNISVWTGESGQQIPQTGLVMIHQNNNNNGSGTTPNSNYATMSNYNNMATTPGSSGTGLNPLGTIPELNAVGYPSSDNTGVNGHFGLLSNISGDHNHQQQQHQQQQQQQQQQQGGGVAGKGGVGSGGSELDLFSNWNLLQNDDFFNVGSDFGFLP